MSSGPMTKTVSMEVEFPSAGFTRSMFFNRFSIEKLGVHTLSHFGLVSESGVLIDSYICFFSKQAIDKNQNRMIRYLENIGRTTVSSVAPWPGVSTTPQRIDIVDLIHASSGEEAELCFANLAIGPNLRRGKTTKAAVSAQAITILRSDLETHKLWIDQLYREV